MLRKLTITVSCVWLSMTPAIGQVTPPAAPASQPTEQPQADTATTQQADLANMPVEELLVTVRGLLAANRIEDADFLARYILTERDPANLDARVLQAAIAEVQGNMNRARMLYQEVLAVQTSHFEANFNLGRAWTRSRLWRQAAYYLETAARVAPADQLPAVRTELAKAYQGLNEPAKAVESVRMALNADPDHFEARQLLVVLHANREEYDQAIANAQLMVNTAAQRVQEAPADVTALRLLQGAYTLQLQVLQRYQTTMYELAANGRPTDQLLPGRQRQAAETLAQIVEIMVLQTDLSRTMAHHEILAFAERLVEYAPNDVEALMRYGLLLRNTKRFDDAILVFESVLANDPDNSQAKQQLEALQALQPEQPAAETATQPSEQP
jgi:tetratricopeptide (TPR) repeat protein